MGRTVERKLPSLPPSIIDREANSIFSFNVFIRELFARDYFRYSRYISEQNRQESLPLWTLCSIGRPTVNISGRLVLSAECRAG